MDTNIGQDIRQEEDFLKDTRTRSLNTFESKESFNIAVLKAERLASALYLVSNLISDDEPLKWTLRKCGTDVITDIVKIGIRGGEDRGHRMSLEKISAKIFEITSLLQVAWMGGLVSKMNFEILRSEYFRLGDFLKNKFYFAHSDSFLISPDFFSSTEIKKLRDRESALAEENKKNEDNYLREVKKINSEENISASAAGNVYIKDISNDKRQIENNNNFVFYKKRTLSSIGLNEFKNTKPLIEEMSDSGKKKRHDLILSSLKVGISYAVPEILKLIGLGSDLSEKTIQRDLLFLVASGRLKKTGERRWSRYSLVG